MNCPTCHQHISGVRERLMRAAGYDVARIEEGERRLGWHASGDLCLGAECQVIDADGDHPTADIHSDDWYDGYESGQRDAAREGLDLVHAGVAQGLAVPDRLGPDPILVEGSELAAKTPTATGSLQASAAGDPAAGGTGGAVGSARNGDPALRASALHVHESSVTPLSSPAALAASDEAVRP